MIRTRFRYIFLKIMPSKHKFVYYRNVLREESEERQVNEIPSEIMDSVFLFIWAREKPGRAKSAKLVKVELKSRAKQVRRKQYPEAGGSYWT